MLFAFAACNDNSSEPETTKSYTEQETVEDVTVQTEEEETLTVSTVTVTDTNGETLTVVDESVTASSADPSEWTDEEIVAFYKAAAEKSKTKVKSTEYKNLREMVVNEGDGVLGKLVEMATPFLISALEDSQVEFDGITGGYENLDPADAQSIKAYKSGKYTVVEMTMKEQVDGVHADRYSGTVGHAISVVGDLAAVQEALPMFEIGFDKAELKLHYRNATVKVKINEDGIIEKGTWSYEIYITAANLYVAAKRLPLAATVESGYGTVDYKITVGGGF